jgi:hypothetical protein
MSSLVTTKSFCAGDGTLQIENLYSLLDVLWQEERQLFGGVSSSMADFVLCPRNLKNRDRSDDSKNCRFSEEIKRPSSNL